MIFFKKRNKQTTQNNIFGIYFDNQVFQPVRSESANFVYARCTSQQLIKFSATHMLTTHPQVYSFIRMYINLTSIGVLGLRKKSGYYKGAGEKITHIIFSFKKRYKLKYRIENIWCTRKLLIP